MDRSVQKRLLQRRLSFEIVNWLKKLYSINPYPDRYQYGTMALHCKIDASRVQNWFVSRRASDWRRGHLCRRCRYFKSPLATEELHQLNPNSRHCVFLTMPQYLQNVANQTGVPLARSTPSPTIEELDIVNNERARTLFPSPAPLFPQSLEHQPYIYRQHIQYSQSAIPYQMHGQQFGGMMPHQLPYSSQMRQNFHQKNECVPFTSIQGANAGNNGGFTYLSLDQKSSAQTCWSSNQNIASRSCMPIATPSAAKLENNEFVQENSILNTEFSGEDYSQIIYPDYMDFPHFPLSTNNVNLKPF